MSERRDDEARLALRLSTADQIEVPTGDFDRLRRRVQRRRRGRAAVASCAAVLVLAAGGAVAARSAEPRNDHGVSASESARMTSTTATTEVVATSSPNKGVTITHLPLDSPVATAVAELLPGRPAVRSVVETKADASVVAPGNFIKIGTVQNGVGYEVTVYRIFAESEFIEVPQFDIAGGRGWIGSLDPARAGIYYLSDASGVGVRIAHLTTGSEVAPDSLQALGAIAIAVTADPTVVQVARDR